MTWLEQARIKAIERRHPERIPVEVGILPSAWMKYRNALDELVRRHPLLFGAEGSGPRDYDAVWGERYTEGDHLDAWGCVWSNVKRGSDAIVTRHPVPTREAVRSLRIPEVDEGLPHGFMYLRLADLRGFDRIMLDFAEEPPELQMLIDKVLAYNLRQVERRLDALVEPGQIVRLGDDLGMQDRFPVHPRTWRKYLKPCFAQIFRPFRDAGHYVYMHTDGHILEIIPDLIECGVNVLNVQVGANGLDHLAHACKGKICVDLDLNRQMFPFWRPPEIDEHIRSAVESLGSPEGGLWLKAWIADDVPVQNVEAICAALEKYSVYFATGAGPGDGDHGTSERRAQRGISGLP